MFRDLWGRMISTLAISTLRVDIQVVAGNTVVTIDGNTITLNGIAAGVTVQDFIL